MDLYGCGFCLRVGFLARWEAFSFDVLGDVESGRCSGVGAFGGETGWVRFGFIRMGCWVWIVV